MPGNQTDSAAMANKLVLYAGGCGPEETQGIYRVVVDLRTGAITPAELAAASLRPSFLALHPNGGFLYAVNELREFQGLIGGALSAFRIEASGSLTLVNQISSRGALPCYATMDAGGRHLLFANYRGPHVGVVTINDDGGLGRISSLVGHHGHGLHPVRQQQPHPHSICLDLAGRRAFAPDLGIDEIIAYDFDPGSGELARCQPATIHTRSGAGPRHFAFHPTGRFAYAICELDSTIMVFAYDGNRRMLSAIQTVSTVPLGYSDENTGAGIAVHPGGRFLYGSNRGHDSLAVFSIDETTGRLAPIGHVPSGGHTPRHFAIDPDGGFLAVVNQGSDNLQIFRINSTNGDLSEYACASIPKPACVTVVVE